MGRPGYPAEFRRKVLDLLDDSRSMASVAHDLDVSDQTIYNWRRRDRIDRGEQPGLTTAEKGELAAAKKRIAELDTELKIAQRAVDLLRRRPAQKRDAAVEVIAADPGTIIHSDQGVQFGSWAFTKRARDSGLLAPMVSIGDCYDNSMIESFWSRMQVELLDRKKWNTRLELANAIFEYLEIWHNRNRRHSQLGWLTPIEFERNRIITVA